MTMFDEKRKGADRRHGEGVPPQGLRDRRKARNRRQTTIAEITLNEWVKSYLRFQKRVAAKAQQKETAEQEKVIETSLSGWSEPPEEKPLTSHGQSSHPPISGDSRLQRNSQSPSSQL